MKKSLVLLTAALAGGIFAISNNISTPVIANAATEETSSITEESDGISDSLRTAIAKKEGIDVSAVTKDYLGTLTGTLDLSEQNISDLSGIQYAKSLTGLDVSGNAITDFSPLNKLTSLIMDNVSLSSQIVSIPTIYLDDNQTTFNLYNYLPSNISINNGNMSLYADTEAIANDVNADVDSRDLSNIKITNFNSPYTMLCIYIQENITINGEKERPQIGVYQPYVSKRYSNRLNAKDVTLNQGEKWDPKIALVSVTSDGVQVPGYTSEALQEAFDGNLVKVSPSTIDTNKPGTYTVKYYSPEDTAILPATSKVTVLPKSTGHSNRPTISNESDLNNQLLIAKETGPMPIYNSEGNKISDKTLNKLSTFRAIASGELNGNTYYEISNDQWVKSYSVREYTKASGVLQSKSDSYKQLLDANGVKLNRGLKQTTDWLYDGYAEFNGTKYYRVATDEWVKADDVILINGINGVVKANTQATLYKDTGDQSNRALAKGSSFVTDKISKTIDNETMYRVATDEWVKASNVTFN